MNQTLWNAVGNIGDDLIADANRENVSRHFTKAKRNLWAKYGSIAACLCLLICLCLPFAAPATENKGEHSPEIDPNDKSINSFADLHFNCVNSYTDDDGNDILLFDVSINHWINNADGYVKQLYISSDNGGLIGISAFGRDLPTVQINGKEYLKLDTTQGNSVYNLNIYLSFKYAKGTLIQGEAYENTNNLTVYLNGIDESCRGEIKFNFKEQNDEKAVILTDINELRELTDAILPTVFPTKATLINQILWYPEIECFSVSYRTDNILEGYTVRRSDSENVYGGQSKETYLYNGTEYTVVTDEYGYEYPPFNIDFKADGYYYSIRVDVRRQVDVNEFIQGLSAEY